MTSLVMRRLSLLFVWAILFVANSLPAAGQSFQGGLRGAVRDANGVVPGVEVTLINEGTQAARSVRARTRVIISSDAVTAAAPVGRSWGGGSPP